ncbi:MAG: ATP-dependent helicase, partial [Allobaculum sp.]|nr:ATP-dependent helicase [Allobaculum sp.]
MIAGTPKQREAAISRDADLYLIGKENVPWLVDYMGRDWKWDMVVIDELSTFKNPQAKRFKALKTV